MKGVVLRNRKKRISLLAGVLAFLFFLMPLKLSVNRPFQRRQKIPGKPSRTFDVSLYAGKGIAMSLRTKPHIPTNQ